MELDSVHGLKAYTKGPAVLWQIQYFLILTTRNQCPFTWVTTEG